MAHQFGMNSVEIDPAGNGCILRWGIYYEGSTHSSYQHRQYKKVYKKEEMEAAYSDLITVSKQKMSYATGDTKTPKSIGAYKSPIEGATLES